MRLNWISIVSIYMSGFGNSFESQALEGTLPVGRNSPQKVNHGLYAEQLSGSPFTAPQASNTALMALPNSSDGPARRSFHQAQSRLHPNRTGA